MKIATAARASILAAVAAALLPGAASIGQDPNAPPAADPNAPGTAGRGPDNGARRPAPADPEAPARDPSAQPATPPDPLADARRLLDKDDFEEALAAARRLVEKDSASAAARTLLGDALYRRGDFEEAEEAYRAGVAADPNSAAAHFGVGRILRTMGRYGEAAESFHRAATLAPDNAKYLRVLSNHAARRADVIRLLERYLEMPPAEDERTINNVRAWIELLRTLGDEPLGEIVKSDPTDLPINVLKGQAYLKADVDGLASQRFAYDTGATGITVSPRLAARAKLKPIRPFTITGMGGKGIVTGDLVVIRRFTLGGVSLRNVAATVADPAGPEEGLLGPSILGAFRQTVDLYGGLLGLRMPPPSGAAPETTSAPPAGAAPSGVVRLPFRNVGGQIIVKASLNGVPLNAMVDTGASSSLASQTAAPRVAGLELLPGEWMQGRSVGLGGTIPRKALRSATLAFAGKEFKADGMACVDLSRFSRAVESEIYLVIGSPELSQFVMEIDYRAMTLTLTPRAR